jgi:hypothetical protein
VITGIFCFPTHAKEAGGSCSYLAPRIVVGGSTMTPLVLTEDNRVSMTAE